MKFKIAKLTTEELQESLDENLVDLLGDVLMLNCLLHCSRQDVLVASCFTGEVTGEAIARLNSYIKQHTDEVCSLCRILTRFL